MPSDDRIRVLHMVEATETAIRFAAGRRREDLDDDQMLLFALVRAVEVIGEAAARVGEATRTLEPGIPWSLIVAMRNRLIHAYFEIDRDVLWRTVTDELPALLPVLRAVLAAQS